MNLLEHNLKDTYIALLKIQKSSKMEDIPLFSERHRNFYFAIKKVLQAPSLPDCIRDLERAIEARRVAILTDNTILHELVDYYVQDIVSNYLKIAAKYL